MKHLTQTAVNGLLLVGIMALNAPAIASGSNEIQIQRAIKKSVLEQKTPFQKYQEQLQALTPADKQTKPTLENLLPALHELTAYNTQLSAFATWDEASHHIAQEINQPVKTYWNMYRGNSLVEILNDYIPDNHGDKALAQLEFLVKKNLFSYKDWLENKALTDLLPEDFVFEQIRLEVALAALPTRDAKAIIHNLVGLAKQYNDIYQDEKTRPMALQLHEVYFRQPIRTGWDKTVTVKELRSQYGMASYTTPFSADELVARYNVSQEEAEALNAFFSNYHN